MYGGELLVLLLSAVPLVENRGAMFVGFALGITDPFIYLLGTLANIASVPFWAGVIRKIPLPLPAIKASPLPHIPVLMALPYNGVNMASALYFSRLFKVGLKELFPYLALGIILRGAATYLFLIGLLSFMGIYEVIILLVLWLLASILWKKFRGKN